MKLRYGIAVLGAMVVALAALSAAGPSGAVFSSAGDTKARAGTDRIQNWLRLYSQATDPEHDTGYAKRRGSSPVVPAATSEDETIAVHLGGFSSTANTTVNRVVTMKGVPAFPVPGVAQITATAYLVADPSTGDQPINSIGFAAFGGTARTNPITVNAGQKYQLNLRVRMHNLTWGTLYQPRVQIVVTYTGFTTIYYRYELVVKAYYGNGAGPD